MNEHLIIDVGMHIGKDTEFYLKKGFEVVAIEANPTLVQTARTRLDEYLSSGRLTIYNLAIAPLDGEIDFFVSDKHDDWSTTSKHFVELHERLYSANYSVIKVKCTTFERILKDCGIPYYLKIDVEGTDTLCLQELLRFDERPRYVSIEVGPTFKELSLLWELGYRKFKVVNQALNSTVRCPNPPLEGKYVDHHFDGLSSGPFGEEAPGKWMGIERTSLRYGQLALEQRFFRRDAKLSDTAVHRLYERLHRAPIGWHAWYDVHAKLGSHLAGKQLNAADG